MARSGRENSWELLEETLRRNIEDVPSGTTAEGIHLGAIAGTVDLIERGYIGLGTRGGTLYFNPCLPQKLKALHLRLFYRRHSLDVSLNQGTFQIGPRPSRSAPIRISINGKPQKLKTGKIVSATVS